jgi:hypothetical protein
VGGFPIGGIEMHVKVLVETDVWMTDPGEPPDVEWGNRESYDGRVVDVEVQKTDLPVEEKWYGDSVFEIDTVVVDYSTGDTFGRDGGYYQVLDVFEDPNQAQELKRLAEAYTHDYGKRVQQSQLTYLGKKYYAGWLGYFECVNEIAVWECDVRDPNFRRGRKR